VPVPKVLPVVVSSIPSTPFQPVFEKVPALKLGSELSITVAAKTGILKNVTAAKTREKVKNMLKRYLNFCDIIMNKFCISKLGISFGIFLGVSKI
jgi:hypothetical protein